MKIGALQAELLFSPGGQWVSNPAPSPLHPDAINFRDLILANGGSIRTEDLEAFSVFATTVAPIRSKILHYSPVAGNDLAAALVKFYRAPHESSPLLTNTGFVPADYSPALGLLGANGKSLNSGFTPSLSAMTSHTVPGGGSIYSAGLGCWVTMVNNPQGGNNVDMGVFGPTGQGNNFKRLALYVNVTDTASQIYGLNAGAQVFVSGTPRTGFLFGNANDTDHRLFDDATIVASASKGLTSDEQPAAAMLFMALNNNPGGVPTPELFSLNRARHFIMTLGMTTPECVLLSNAMATLQGVLASSPPAPLHPDAISYRDLILANGGTIRPQDVEAFSVFATTVAPIRSKILHYSPVAGNDLAAAQVKFYRDSHESSHLLTFVNVVPANYSPALGFQAGTGRHINSGFTPNLSPMRDFTANGALSAGLGCFLVSAGSGVDMGADHTAGLLGQRRVLIMTDAGIRYLDLYTTVERLTYSSAVLGFTFGSLDGNTMTHFDDGASIGNRARSNITGQDMRPNVPVFFGCNNAQGVAAFHSTRQLRHFILTLGMTNSEVALLSTAIANLQAFLSS